MNEVKFLKEYWFSILTVIFMIIVGILLLIDPIKYAMIIIRVAGVLLAVFGLYDIIKYFRTDPLEAAQGTGFFSGAIMIAIALLILLGGRWIAEVFPALSVLFGVFQIMIGFRKLQYMVDAIRLHNRNWVLRGISAAITLLFGFIITLNPVIPLVSIWVFTGITLIVVGMFDAAAIIVQYMRSKEDGQTA